MTGVDESPGIYRNGPHHAEALGRRGVAQVHFAVRFAEPLDTQDTLFFVLVHGLRGTRQADEYT